jgi:hypothetical protein
MTDGRRDKRVEAHVPVKIRWPGRTADELVNVSAKGIQVHTTDPLNAPTLVAMEIAHPLCAVNVLGHVRWATADTMGIEFDERDERVAALFTSPSPSPSPGTSAAEAEAVAVADDETDEAERAAEAKPADHVP